MTNEKFQKLVLNGFKEMNERFRGIDQRFDTIDAKLNEHDLHFVEIRSELADLKVLSGQHHEELEKVARQVQKSLQATEKLIEIDNDYLAKRSSLKLLD
ncbi:MAG: hypothetical protein AAGU75_24305 [Bacillota bacterium]